MKDLLIVANWKANKNKNQTIEYFERLEQLENVEGKEVAICPPYTLLDVASSWVYDKNISVKIGAQDVSQFSQGAYTGEVTAEQVKEFATYVLIGHSERRSNFSEDFLILSKKVEEVLKNNLTPIYCVSNPTMEIPKGVKIVAYEPLDAIGTGRPETVENASAIALEIKGKNREVEKVLYGGSITAENVNSFTSSPNIDGVLVGGASLDPSELLTVIENA